MPAATITGITFAMTVVACVYKLLLLVVLRVTRDRQEVSPFKHTPLIGGRQWRLNRMPPPLDPDAVDEPNPPFNPTAPFDREEEDIQFGLAPYVADQPDGFVGEEQMPEHLWVDPATLMQATCISRAVFTTPDSIQGIFIQLPSDGDELMMPYLFVQVHEVTQLPKPRFGARHQRVEITFSSVDVGCPVEALLVAGRMLVMTDFGAGERNVYSPGAAYCVQVGGLDREFVEHHVCNDPGKAWKALENFQSGIDVDEPALLLPQHPLQHDSLPITGGVEHSPDVPQPDDGMTPRTKAATQRL